MSQTPRATATIAGHPLHAMLVPIPMACFIGTFVTDLAYWQTANMQWANFSAWLLAVGLLLAAVAAIGGLLDYLFRRRAAAPYGARGYMGVHVIGYGIAILLAIFNSFIHSRDAYSSVVPDGLILSVLTVLVLLATGWHGWSVAHRPAAGVWR